MNGAWTVGDTPSACTCTWPSRGYPDPRTGYDPDCPQHGTDAMLAQADPTLDIDEPEGRAATANGS